MCCQATGQTSWAVPFPGSFTGVTLELYTIRLGQRFGRIYHEHYPDPLGLGKTKSRFSDPRRRPEDERFGVLYLGSTLKGCFVEAILRDRRNGVVGDYPIGVAELFQRIKHDLSDKVVRDAASPGRRHWRSADMDELRQI